MICADGPVDFLRSRALIVKREGRRLQHELARVRVTQLYIYSSKRSVTAIRSAQARASGSVCGVLSGVIERAKTQASENAQGNTRTRLPACPHKIWKPALKGSVSGGVLVNTRGCGYEAGGSGGGGRGIFSRPR